MRSLEQRVVALWTPVVEAGFCFLIWKAAGGSKGFSTIFGVSYGDCKTWKKITLLLTSSSLSLRLVLAGGGETSDQMNVQYCTETSLFPQSTKNFQGKLCFTSFKAWSYYCSLKRQEYRKTGQFKSLDPGLFSCLFSLLCRLQPTCPISSLTDPLNTGTVPVLQGGKTRTEKNIYYHGTQ